VKLLETPQQMWEQLQGHFEEHVSLQVEMLQTQLNNIRQKDGEGIDSYAARIAKICEQLNAARYKTDINRPMKGVPGVLAYFAYLALDSPQEVIWQFVIHSYLYCFFY